MNGFLDAVAAAMRNRDDDEPAAEWLGGEAWVTATPAAFCARDRKRVEREEPAAADWIPV